MNTLLLTLANMGVNLDDVADVVNNCIPQLIFFGVVVATAIIVLIAMAVNKKLAKPTKFMVRAQSGLAVLLAFGIMLNLVAFGPMSTMLDLVTGNGTITKNLVQRPTPCAPRLPRKASSCCRTMTTNCPSRPAAT